MVVQTSTRFHALECAPPASALLRSKKRTLERAIEYVRHMSGQTVVKFAGVDSIGDALSIVGYEMYVERDVSLGPQPAIMAELVGYRVFDLQGEEWGVVSGVQDNAMNPLLEVSPPGGGSVILVPFREPIVRALDADQRVIRIDPPPGLRELFR